jgi:TRAP-type C4-dicarboxylate transport system substrate-binding protein
MRLIGVFLVAALLAGCSHGSAGDKAGGDAAPVTLRMTTLEGVGMPYAPGVQEFARQVRTLSKGSLRIDIVWEGANTFLGEFGPGSDQNVARLVASGKKVDMALIPARAWDELGVTGLQALQAPFLISTENLTADVVQGEIGRDMLASLEKAGVVGLTLLPEALRHPFGFRGPLVTLEDFAGTTIRDLPSRSSDRLLEALGARPVDLCCDELDAAFRSGRVDGAESELALGGDLPVPGTVTANLTLFPKVNAVVANKDRFDRLSAKQRAVLREAAARAQRFVIEHSPTESRLARIYCANGGRIAFATPSALAAFERAAAPVYATLEQDVDTAAFIQRIRAMKGTAPGSRPALPATCAPPPRESRPSAVSQPSRFPEGVYRINLTPDYLIARGMDTLTAHAIAGLNTLTVRDGRWRGRIQGIPGFCGGPYTVTAGRISIRGSEGQCGVPKGTLIMSARWRLEHDDLLFFDVREGRPPEWGAKPWKKIE